MRHVLATFLCAAWSVTAIAATPPETEGSGQKVTILPPDAGTESGGGEMALPRPRPTAVPERVPVREAGPAPDIRRASADAGALKNLVLVRIEAGAAQVTLAGASRTLREGDTIAGDVVRRVDAERIVLDRAGATVIVTFDSARRAVVRVYSLAGHTASEAPRAQ
jgi:hypothetical protein